jgi:hypothetical protein
MSRLRTALSHRREIRARRRAERDLARAWAAAPTVESAHEIATLGTRL